jgi:hypothetical protein
MDGFIHMCTADALGDVLQCRGGCTEASDGFVAHLTATSQSHYDEAPRFVRCLRVTYTVVSHITLFLIATCLHQRHAHAPADWHDDLLKIMTSVSPPADTANRSAISPPRLM